MIALVALVCAAPFVSAWVAYYLIQPGGGKSYGALLPTQPLPALPVADPSQIVAGGAPVAASPKGQGMPGKWSVVVSMPDPCDAVCEATLYATRQARTMLGKERERVQRIVVSPGKAPSAFASNHPDALVVTANDSALPMAWSSLLGRGVVLVDPLGNQVLLWPLQPDPKKLNQDLSRLLRASRIG